MQREKKGKSPSVDSSWDHVYSLLFPLLTACPTNFEICQPPGLRKPNLWNKSLSTYIYVYVCVYIFHWLSFEYTQCWVKEWAPKCP